MNHATTSLLGSVVEAEAQAVGRSCGLVHLDGSRKSAVEIIGGGFARLGRGPDNDVAFDAFAVPMVSARHAGIRREGGDFVLYDMGSLNGTWLNGAAVGRGVLRDGDEISLGRTGPRLRVRLGIASSPPSSADSSPSTAPSRRPPSPVTPQRTTTSDRGQAIVPPAATPPSSTSASSRADRGGRLSRGFEGAGLAVMAGVLALAIGRHLAQLLFGF